MTAAKRTGPSPAVRDLVLARSGGSCERCGASLDSWPPAALHHRRPRGAGGSRRLDTNLPGNLVALCHADHAEVESERASAIVDGWIVSQRKDPALVPVLLFWHGLSWLKDDGSIQPVRNT